MIVTSCDQPRFRTVVHAQRMRGRAIDCRCIEQTDLWKSLARTVEGRAVFGDHTTRNLTGWSVEPMSAMPNSREAVFHRCTTWGGNGVEFTDLPSLAISRVNGVEELVSAADMHTLHRWMKRA